MHPEIINWSAGVLKIGRCWSPERDHMQTARRELIGISKLTAFRPLINRQRFLDQTALLISDNMEPTMLQQQLLVTLTFPHRSSFMKPESGRPRAQ